jgi:hypothetical protein
MGNNLFGENLPLDPDFLRVQYEQPTLEQITADEAAAGGGVLLVAQGGTGANTAAAARSSLGTAPLTPTYITQTANAELPNEQSLAALATGYMKVTTATGLVASQAVPIPLTDGGTGGTSAATARASLGVPKYNSAAVAPGVTDDTAAGYSVNSLWVDTVFRRRVSMR